MKIVMAVAPGPKPWSWKTLESEPLGGSESAAIYLADALARCGHEVVLRGPVSSEPSPAGVQYIAVNDPSGPLEGDVVIVSRIREWLPHFRAGIKAFWAHDLMDHDSAPRTDNGECNLILALSRFAAQCFPGRQIALIPNGIDAALFEDIPVGDLTTRQAGKLAWTSNFDRGLFVAVRIVQKLRKRWPHLELHVYGGMDVYGWDKGREAAYLPSDLDGVVLHGSLPKRELYRELGTCWAWFYPTWWPETFCIAALEAQAAGLPCVTVPVGALVETVSACKPSYDLETTIENLMYVPSWESLSKRAAEFGRGLTWDAVASGMSQLLTKGLEGRVANAADA